MGVDVFVNQLQRVGIGAVSPAAGSAAVVPGLAPPQSAITLDPAYFALVDDPNAIATGPRGESITGATRVTLASSSAPLSGSSLTLGGATYGPAPTFSIGASPVALATVNVPVGKVAAFSLMIVGEIFLPSPGCILPFVSYETVAVASYGTSGILGVLSATLTAQSFPQGSGLFAFSSTSTATTYSLTLATGTAPAWQASTAYTGTLPSGATLPGNGILVNASLVTHGGNLYVCSAGGTSAGSGGPTGTGSTAITDGGVTWWYVGPAATVLTLSCTAALLPAVGG